MLYRTAVLELYYPIQSAIALSKMSLINRAASLFVRRSCISQNKNIPYAHFSIALQQQPQRILDNNRNGITQQTPPVFPTHDKSITNTCQIKRSMVMVTQTISSEENNEDTNSPTSQQHQTNDNIDTTTTTINNSEQTLNITGSCAARIKQLASTRPSPDKVFLRLYVDAGGCSGFQYKFLLLSEDNTEDNDDEEDGTIDPEEDIVLVKDGMRVVVDQTSLDLLRGSTIDYVQEMIRSSFAVVGNPQSESACGCGSSFAVKNFDSNPALD